MCIEEDAGPRVCQLKRQRQGVDVVGDNEIPCFRQRGTPRERVTVAGETRMTAKEQLTKRSGSTKERAAALLERDKSVRIGGRDEPGAPRWSALVQYGPLSGHSWIAREVRSCENEDASLRQHGYSEPKTAKESERIAPISPRRP